MPLPSPSDLYAEVANKLAAQETARRAAIATWLANPAVRETIENYLYLQLAKQVELSLRNQVEPSVHCALELYELTRVLRDGSENIAKTFTVQEVGWAILAIAIEAGYPEERLDKGFLSANPKHWKDPEEVPGPATEIASEEPPEPSEGSETLK